MAAKYSEWTRGQDEALLNKLGGMDVVLKILGAKKVTVTVDEEKGEATVAVVKPSRSPATRLRRASTAALPERTSVFDPDKFFQTQTGRYIWDYFRDRVVAAAKPVESLPAAEIASFDLVKNATDMQIQGELPEGHVFEDTSVFCAYLATMIERQEGGAAGDLLANGYANIFYVCGVAGEVFAVRAYWYAVRREWFVHAYFLGARQWRAGPRVFSRNC